MKIRTAAKLLLLILLGLSTSFILGEVAVRISSRWILWYDVEMWKYAQGMNRVIANYDMAHEHLPDRELKLMGVMVKTNPLGLRERSLKPVPDPQGSSARHPLVVIEGPIFRREPPHGPLGAQGQGHDHQRMRSLRLSAVMGYPAFIAH